MSGIYLNEIFWKAAIDVLERDTKIKPSPGVERDLKIWQVKLFPVFVCKVVYS